jgi:DNA recombination-mediator protein A
MERAGRCGVRFVALGEPDYPRTLQAIETAPPLLAVRGSVEALRRPTVAIVGSRNASAAGLTFAERLARELGSAGYVVVSGLARGIDARAHKAALATGTVAVLAGGHERVYSAENAPLLERIVEEGGAVGNRDAARMGAARARFPTPQPDRVGAVLRGRRHRGGAPLGIADHRLLRLGAGPRGLCCAGLAARSAGGGRQRSHPRRRHPVRLRRACHGRSCPSHRQGTSAKA